MKMPYVQMPAMNGKRRRLVAKGSLDFNLFKSIDSGSPVCVRLLRISRLKFNLNPFYHLETWRRGEGTKMKSKISIYCRQFIGL